VKLFAGSLKGFAHRRSCLRLQRNMFCGGIDWHGPTPEKAQRCNLETSWEAVKYNSGYIHSRPSR